MTLPYPLPGEWRLHESQLTRRWPAIVWSVIAVGLASGMVAANVAAVVGSAILLAFLFGAVGAGLGVSYQREGTNRGMPHLINAVVLTRARVRPPDSWVHFFREAGPSRWLTTCFAATGILMSTSLVWTFVAVLGEGGAALLWLLLVVPLLLAALVLALAGAIALVQFVRHASFGHRHIGISIGRHGLVRYYLDEVDVWPWENIIRVEALGRALDAQTEDFSAHIVLVANSLPADVTENKYSIDGYQSHPWLIYTAVRFWTEHPELRSELGTTFAQRRIDGWSEQMVPGERAQAQISVT